MREPLLVDVQRLFFEWITSEASIHHSLLGPDEPRPAEPALMRLFAAPDAGFATARLSIYADAYASRLLDVLRGDFPKLAALVGETTFRQLIAEYLHTHPSSHPSLRYLGEHMPSFMRQHPLLERWPYLADLVSLEWERNNAFDAANVTPLQLTDLAAIPAESWGNLTFTLSPAFRIRRFDYPVQDTWLALDQDEPPFSALDLAPKDTTLLIWRRDFLVYHRAAEPVEVEALELLEEGATFGAVCEYFAESQDLFDMDCAAQNACTALVQWLTDGLIHSSI